MFLSIHTLMANILTQTFYADYEKYEEFDNILDRIEVKDVDNLIRVYNNYLSLFGLVHEIIHPFALSQSHKEKFLEYYFNEFCQSEHPLLDFFEGTHHLTEKDMYVRITDKYKVEAVNIMNPNKWIGKRINDFMSTLKDSINDNNGR